MTMSEGKATIIIKNWERAGIAGIVENMTDFPDEDPLSNIAIHFVLCVNENVRSILCDCSITEHFIYFHLYITIYKIVGFFRYQIHVIRLTCRAKKRLID